MHTYLYATASQNRCRFGAKRRGCDKCPGHTYAQSYTNAHTHTHIPVCQQRLKIDADLVRNAEAALRVGGTHIHNHTPTHTRIHTHNHIPTHTRTHTHNHTPTHTHIHTHTYTHIPVSQQRLKSDTELVRNVEAALRVGVHWETSVKPPATHRVCVKGGIAL